MKLLQLPGLIDPHVHLRDPGQTEKEDFYTGTAAALRGGYTTVIDMPNNTIPITTEERLTEKRMIAKEKIVCDTGFYFGSLGDNLEEFEKVHQQVFGLKLFLNHTTGGYIIDEEKLETIYNAWTGESPILVHAEEETLETVLKIVRKTGKRTHVCHISSQFELEHVMIAKEAGLPVTCGVTPHHLFLTEQDGVTLGPFGKVKPPLKKPSDVAFLWKYLPAIDVIESDHAPHTRTEKESEPTYGFPGLETTLPLLLTAMHEGKLSLERIVSLCHENPARIFSIPPDPDTVIEIDTDYAWTIENNSLVTKSQWSPFAGRKVQGKVRQVTLRGTTVLKNDSVTAQAGFGRLLSR